MKKIGIFILLLLSIFAAGCNQEPFTKAENPFTEEEKGESEQSPVGPNFQIIKSQVFSVNKPNACLKCHVDLLSSYQRTKGVLVEIEEYLKTDGMPKGGPPLPEETKELFYTWVRLGAPE
ncbi:MAG: hypothetical protein ACAH59_11410 [Pseudobdellovibrionaceae bacterium]